MQASLPWRKYNSDIEICSKSTPQITHTLRNSPNSKVVDTQKKKKNP